LPEKFFKKNENDIILPLVWSNFPPFLKNVVVHLIKERQEKAKSLIEKADFPLSILESSLTF
jgi:hypothetical protein